MVSHSTNSFDQQNTSRCECKKSGIDNRSIILYVAVKARRNPLRQKQNPQKFGWTCQTWHSAIAIKGEYHSSLHFQTNVPKEFTTLYFSAGLYKQIKYIYCSGKSVIILSVDIFSGNHGFVLPLQLWLVKGECGLGLFGVYLYFSTWGLCLRIRVKYKNPSHGNLDENSRT